MGRGDANCTLPEFFEPNMKNIPTEQLIDWLEWMDWLNGKITAELESRGIEVLIEEVESVPISRLN
jgi:hypothetical protein